MIFPEAASAAENNTDFVQVFFLDVKTGITHRFFSNSDGILSIPVSYTHLFEGKREGFLTNTRSKIVQRETLNKLAVEIGLDKLIKYSTRSSSHNSYLYGNAFEAFIGAIYLDQGYARCKQFMEQRIINRYIDLDKLSRKEVNFKSKLIECCATGCGGAGRKRYEMRAIPR